VDRLEAELKAKRDLSRVRENWTPLTFRLRYSSERQQQRGISPMAKGEHSEHVRFICSEKKDRTGTVAGKRESVSN